MLQNSSDFLTPRAPAIYRKEISVFITDSVASQVKKEMMEWGSKPGVSKLASALQDMANENDALLKSANIQLDNS